MDRTYFKVYHISFAPNGYNDVPTIELDERTERVRTFDTKAAAIAYIEEVKDYTGKWLAKIALSKVVETDEPIA